MKELLATTGYIRGGCSPVGMKKPFPTYIDETCILYDYIYVSAGVRGLQFRLTRRRWSLLWVPKPVDLIAEEDSMNTLGKILTLTTFGESHGPAMGGVLDGMPAGVDIDLDALQRFVDRRRTGQTAGSSTRDELDGVEVLSGIWQERRWERPSATSSATPMPTVPTMTTLPAATGLIMPTSPGKRNTACATREAAVVPQPARPWRV